jgi:hypothetical protein
MCHSIFTFRKGLQNRMLRMFLLLNVKMDGPPRIPFSGRIFPILENRTVIAIVLPLDRPLS